MQPCGSDQILVTSGKITHTMKKSFLGILFLFLLAHVACGQSSGLKTLLGKRWYAVKIIDETDLSSKKTEILSEKHSLEQPYLTMFGLQPSGTISTSPRLFIMGKSIERMTVKGKTLRMYYPATGTGFFEFDILCINSHILEIRSKQRYHMIFISNVKAN